jgi:hypothetical protein
MMMVAVLASCSGDDGAVGPAGPAGVPQPVSVLVLGSDAGVVAKSVRLASALPPGSSINYINVIDSIPPMSVLKSFSASIVYCNSAPNDRDGLGNRLADYVDQGGKLVLLQTCMTTNWGFTGGKMIDPAYMPYVTTASSSDATARTIDQTTLTFPLHPIFVGVDVPNYVRSTLTTLSYPTLQVGATSLCMFSGGVQGVAINPNKRIIGINDYPFTDDQKLYQLAANCVLYLTGRI